MGLHLVQLLSINFDFTPTTSEIRVLTTLVPISWNAMKASKKYNWSKFYCLHTYHTPRGDLELVVDDEMEMVPRKETFPMPTIEPTNMLPQFIWLHN